MVARPWPSLRGTAAGHWFGLRGAARLFVRHARLPLTGAVAVVGALAGRQEGFPRDPRRIIDPGLFRFGVAATGFALLDHVAARPMQARVDLVQLTPVLDLNSQMIETGLPAARGDREIHARIVEHPLGIVALDHSGLRIEQRRIEADRALEVINGDVHVHALHGRAPSSRNLGFLAARRFASCRRGTRLRHATAAVIGEKRDERVHGVELRRVDHRAAFPPHRDQPTQPQPVEMKRERVRREAEFLRDAAGRHAVRPRLDQQAEHVEPIVLGQRSQSRHRVRLFHISTNIEISALRQAP